MQPYPQAGGAQGVQPLGQQRRQHAGQHIAQARTGHCRVATFAQHQLPRWVSHQGAGPLEHADAVITARQLARGPRAVGLHCLGGNPQ
ncbi:hypothetical protein D3C77_465490 [compost metagenome]